MELFKVSLGKDWNIQFELAWWLTAIIAVIVIIVFLSKRGIRFWKKTYFEINEAEIGIGSHKVKIRPNYQDLQIAFKFWAELSTRKIGLPIDEDNDVIAEVYNSWHEFFKIARDLIKQIPVSKLRAQESTKQIVRISIALLNEELRPYLTRWQARYRRWWEAAIQDKENSELSPQELQRKFPEYEKLMSDMKEVNRKLVAYSNTLKRLVHS